MALSGIIKFFTIRAVEGLVAILFITFIPNLPPDAKYSQTYSLAPVVPFEGPLTLNDKLQSAEIWHKGDFNGPEAFAVYNGELYTSIHGGNVVKLIGEDKVAPVVKFGKQCKGFYQEHICGRPLGMQFDKHGGLYVADAYYGIFKVDVKTGKQLQLVSMDQEINGRKPKLPNSVAVASNGDIYWTDSSSEFFLYDGVFDMLADGSGRLIHYDAKTKRNTILMDKLHFANGVKLADDESFVITSETARCRVHRYYLKGPKKGTYDIFLDGLPGLPDNIQTDGKDGFLFSLVIGRDDDYPPPLNIMGQFPLLRKFLSRVLGLTELSFKVLDQIYPSEWAEKAVHYIGHFESLPRAFDSPRQTILHVSKDGVILDSVHSLNGSIVGICEAYILKDMLYMGSPFNNYIARIPLEKIGWGHLALKEGDYPSSAPASDAPTTAKVAQPTPKTAPPTKPSSIRSAPIKEAPTKPPPTKQTTPPSTAQTTTPPTTQPPTKQTTPPSTKQTTPSPTIQTTPPSTKETTPPLTKQTTPPPTKTAPPPTKQTTPPPTKQTTPPSSKETTPPSTKQTTPPSTKQTAPPTTKQTSPPPTKQTSPPPIKQTTPPPPPTKQTTPSSPPTKQTTPPAPPTKQTAPPSPPNKETMPPSPPTKQTTPPSTTQPPKESISKPPPQQKSGQSSQKEEPGKVVNPSTQSPTVTTQKQATPKQAPSSQAETKNEL